MDDKYGLNENDSAKYGVSDNPGSDNPGSDPVTYNMYGSVELNSKPSLANRAGTAAAIVLMLCAAAIVVALTVRICVVIWP